MQISQILRDKGDMVFTIGPEETVAAAARQLEARRVGALVVLDAGRIAGIVSERDIVRLLAEAGGEALDRPVSACMTAEVLTAEPTDSLERLLARMTDRRVRHLPVCDRGRLVGIVSIGDLVKAQIAEISAEADGLKAYISAA